MQCKDHSERDAAAAAKHATTATVDVRVCWIIPLMNWLEGSLHGLVVFTSLEPFVLKSTLCIYNAV